MLTIIVIGIMGITVMLSVIIMGITVMLTIITTGIIMDNTVYQPSCEIQIWVDWQIRQFFGLGINFSFFYPDCYFQYDRYLTV